MENNLDKFFRDKLEQRQFEQKSAYWEEASKLIEREEKRRRRGFFVWWFLGSLSLVMLAGFWYLSSVDSSQPLSSLPSSIETDSEASSNSNEEMGMTLDKTLLEDVSENEKQQTATSENTEITSTASGNEEIANNTSNTTENKEPVVREKQNDNLRTKSKNNTSKTIEKGNDLKYLLENKVTATKRENSTSSSNDLNQNTVKEDKEQSQNSSLLDQANQETKTERPKEPVNEAEQTRMAFMVSGINSLLNELNGAPLTLEEFQLNNPEINPKRVLSNYKWSFGLTAATMLYPYTERTELLIGYLGGISAKYRFNTQWSIGGDLLYQQVGGSFTSLKETEAIEYKFGRQTTTYRLVPEKMHSLYLPIYVQFRNGRSSIEAGAAFNYLLAVRGSRQEDQSLFPWERPSSGDLSERISEQKVWMVKDQFNTWNASLLLGYRYEINKDWSIWGRTSYRLGSVFKNTSVEDAINYIESNPVTIRIGSTFYLF